MFKKKIFELYKKLNMTSNEVSAEFLMILDFLNINPLKEIKEGLNPEEENKILEIVNKRINTGMPLQYIVGFGYFMGEKFLVDKNTLIPRPETEILVEACSKLIDKNSKVLDIGTGSGCIAIGISKLTGASVDAVDISDNALDIAKKNAKLHNVNCNFFYSDLFSKITCKYDLIVSNPPYIPIKDIDTLSIEVSKFEPHAALFAKDIFGIEFYEKITEKSVTFLNKGGHLCFEIGINQKDKIYELLSVYGFSDIKFIKDINNIERVTIAKYF